ncbi:MAG: hypothetical protein AABZ64_16895 [Nitrospinota bacterium]
MATGEASYDPSGYWEGYVSGTNRGPIILCIRKDGDIWHSDAIFEDFAFGPTLLTLRGDIKGALAEFRIVKSYGLAPVLPLDGKVTIDFAKGPSEVDGKWETDIGTVGVCRLYRTRISNLRCSVRFAIGSFMLLCRRRKAAIYVALVLVVAILDLASVLKMSYQSFLLLFVPAVYIFRPQIEELIRAFRVKRIGPVELDQSLPSAEIQNLIKQQVAESLRFMYLNNFFVLRTKFILDWLAQAGTVTLVSFVQYASSIGVPVDNIKVTLDALTQTGCARLEGERMERITISELGQGYVRHLRG